MAFIVNALPRKLLHDCWPSGRMVIRMEPSAIRRACCQPTSHTSGSSAARLTPRDMPLRTLFVLAFLSSQFRCLGVLFLYRIQMSLADISRSLNLLQSSPLPLWWRRPNLLNHGIPRPRICRSWNVLEVCLPLIGQCLQIFMRGHAYGVVDSLTYFWSLQGSYQGSKQLTSLNGTLLTPQWSPHLH